MNICIIPARGGSTRIPRKNIREFHGKPIIAYSIDVAKQVFDRVIVSTDDDEISQIAISYGAEVHKRDEYLACNEVGTQEVAKHVLKDIGQNDQGAINDSTMVCVLYATAPFVKRDDLITAFQKCVLRPCSYVISVPSDRLIDVGNFYIGHAAAFLNGTHLVNEVTGIHVVNHAIDINTEEDWKQAEEIYAKHFK